MGLPSMSGRWPDFLIVGTGRSATTSLYTWLRRHPEIQMPDWKEPHYFAWLWEQNREHGYATPEAEARYRALFADAGDDRIAGEASTTYLMDPLAPWKIRETIPDVKIVASLRDPVERAHSHYWNNRRRIGDEDLPTFGEAVEAEIRERAGTGTASRWYVLEGLYAAQVRRYLDLFDEDQVEILLFDQITGRPDETLQRLAKFLEVDAEAMARIDTTRSASPYIEPRNALFERIRASERLKRIARTILPEPVRAFIGDRVLVHRPDKPPMDPEVRAFLETLYAPDVRRLETVLDRQLPELRASWRRSPGEESI